eukprot:3616891-Pleurochrysis_carterae.AAC.2
MLDGYDLCHARVIDVAEPNASKAYPVRRLPPELRALRRKYGRSPLLLDPHRHPRVKPVESRQFAHGMIGR